MDTDSFFRFKLGHGVEEAQIPKLKLVIMERLFAEFLDANKPRRIMYACKDLRMGTVNLHAEQTLRPWPQSKKTQSSNTDSKTDEASSPSLD